MIKKTVEKALNDQIKAEFDSAYVYLAMSGYCESMNLGGFANVSYNNGKRRAFDIGAVNIVLNELTSIIDLPYDENGAIARGGNLIQNLNEELHQIPYYSSPPPKSIGKEWVEQNCLISAAELAVQNVLYNQFFELPDNSRYIGLN